MTSHGASLNMLQAAYLVGWRIVLCLLLPPWPLSGWAFSRCAAVWSAETVSFICWFIARWFSGVS